MAAAAAVFAATYALLTFQNLPRVHIHRPAAALLGAVAMVVLGVVDLEAAYRLVDLDTLAFLLGMMILIGYLETTGFFEQAEAALLRRARTPRELLALLIASSGVLSAVFMNDTACLMLTPVVLRLVRRARLSPAPFLIALATSSNIGSVATPMGNPQNMIIAVHSKIPFAAFVGSLAPVALLGLALNYALITRLYAPEFAAGRRLDLPGESPPVRSRLLYVCLGATAALLVLFALDVHPPLAALAIAAFVIAAGATRPREAFKHVDWELLLMFAGLFVVMGGVRASGLLSAPLAALASLAGAPLGARVAAVAASSAAVSQVVSNVPCVVFFVHLLGPLGGENALWLALAAASTLAGNFTTIGSIANLIVLEGARKEAPVGFLEYARVGAPLAALLIALSALWLA